MIVRRRSGDHFWDEVVFDEAGCTDDDVFTANHLVGWVDVDCEEPELVSHDHV